jgi:hypothetical protein
MLEAGRNPGERNEVKPMSERPTAKYTTWLYEDQVIWLKQTAATQKISPAELLRQLIDERKCQK